MRKSLLFLAIISAVLICSRRADSQALSNPQKYPNGGPVLTVQGTYFLKTNPCPYTYYGAPFVLPTNAVTFFSNTWYIGANLQSQKGLDFQVISAAGSNVTFWLAPSIGNGFYDSNQVFKVTASGANGTGTNDTMTNLVANGYDGWYVLYASNFCGTFPTTNVLWDLVKRSMW